MQIGEELAAFLTSPIMIIVGTCDAHCAPEVGRGIGARVDRVLGTVEVVLCAWQWPSTVANLSASGRAAVTFARPQDYVSFQLKGPAASCEADAHALACSRRYAEEITAVLCGLGLERRLFEPWLTLHEPVVMRLQVEDVYVQTPGAKAGQPLQSRDV